MSAQFTKRRVPAYMGGLLLSLGAMLVIMQAKKAFAPHFHEIADERAPANLSPGGRIRIVYGQEPGYFLPPGFPTRLTVAKKQPDGTFRAVVRMSYKELTEREPFIGPLAEEGEYSMNSELYVCSAPGVADCAKLLLAQVIFVKAGGAADGSVPIDLPKLANAALEAGKIRDQAGK